ncbi:DUF3641 domain-containing protein, partial [Spirochaetota bacterium]
ISLFIDELGPIKNLSVRTNLVSLEMPENKKFMDRLKEKNVAIIGSLPSPVKEVTDSQRGKGVFEKTISVLKQLNKRGYGSELKLHLVYNPSDGCLPSDTVQLERDYRDALKKDHGIEFNDFFSMVNVPVSRFKKQLQKEGILEEYLGELRDNMNKSNLDKIMCRNIISVDFEGHVYDCDFNLAMGRRIIPYENEKFWDIDFSSFNPQIIFSNYCYACTVSSGSSCHGELSGGKCGCNSSEDSEEQALHSGCC